MRVFGDVGTSPGKFFWPSNVAVASDGKVYVTIQNLVIIVLRAEVITYSSLGALEMEKGNLVDPISCTSTILTSLFLTIEVLWRFH